MMYLRRDLAARLVDDLAHARQFAVLALSDIDNLVRGLGAQMPREMQILPGEILVYEQNLHANEQSRFIIQDKGYQPEKAASPKRHINILDKWSCRLQNP